MQIKITMQNNRRQQLVGTMDPMSTSSEIKKIGEQVIHAIAKQFNQPDTTWLTEFSCWIDNNEQLEALNILYRNVQPFLRYTEQEVLDSALKLNHDKIDKEDCELYFWIILQLALDLQDAHIFLEYAPKILESLPPEDTRYFALCNAQAESHLKLGEHARATYQFNELLKNDNTPSHIQASCYIGLSRISELAEDKCKYINHAIEKYLECGQQKSAADCYVMLFKFFFGKDNDKAENYITEAIYLLDRKELEIVDSELLASMLHSKSTLLFQANQLTDAQQNILRSCELRRGKIGNKEGLVCSLALLKQIAIKSGDKVLLESCEEELKQEQDLIIDETFRLRLELANFLDNLKPLPSDLVSKILECGDPILISGCLLYLSLNEKLTTDEKLEHLEQALKISNDNHIKAIVYYSIGCIYDKAHIINSAITYYEKSLELDRYYSPTAESLINILIKEKQYRKLEEVSKSRIDLLGELSGYCYIYARALFENKKYKVALKYLFKSDKTLECVQKLTEQCYLNISDDSLSSQVETPPSQAISLQSFEPALINFTQFISATQRMTYWKRDGKKHKWVSCPEQQLKKDLMCYLGAKFENSSFEILDEVSAGAGLIDLYLDLGNTKVVVELKICGNGYSSTYAQSGEQQVIHYLQNKPTCIGYLIVADGRIRDMGKGFSSRIPHPNFTIKTLVADMRPTVK